MPHEVKRVRRKRRSGRTGRSEFRRALLLSLGIFLGFAVALLLFFASRRLINDWRESRLVSEAQHSLHDGKLEAAETAARKAFAIDPHSIAACRVLAEVTEKENRIETVAWRSQIANLDPRLDSLLNLASAALRFGQLDLAQQALGRVAPADREKAAYHVVAGWLAHSQGNIVEQQKQFAAAVAAEPQNDVYQFNLAVLEIGSPDPAKSAAARAQLERLSKMAQFRTEALRALVDDALRRNEMTIAEHLAQELQLSPDVTFADYLLCLDLYRKLKQKEFRELLAKVKPFAARRPNDLAQLIDWMNTHGLADNALKWTDTLPSSVTTRPPVAIAIAEALARTSNWSRLKRWTRNDSWGSEDYLRLAYQAYAARRSKREAAEAEFDSLWSSAKEAAEKIPEHQLALARLASRWGLKDEAEQLWQQVAKTPATRREALDALYQIYRVTNDLPNLRIIAERLHETSPQEIDLASNAARFALLLDRNTESGRELARKTYEKAPQNTGAAVAYAFALYSAGQSAQGLEILKKLPSDQLRDPHVAVYVALILDDLGQRAAAREYIDTARKGKLFPEEKQLLDEVIAHEQSPTPSPSPSV